MKKKVLSLAAALLVIGAAEGFSLGLGLQVGGGGGTLGGGEVSFLLSFTDKTHLSVPFAFGGGWFSIGANFDWWLLNLPITNIGQGKLNFFLGPGIGAGLGLVSGGWSWLSIYGRLPVGIDYKIKKFDIFLQVVPSLGLSVYPFYFPHWGIGGYLGARYWL